MRKLTIKNLVFGVICFVLFFASWSSAQQMTPGASEDEELMLFPQTDVPYGGACFLNYGFSFAGNVGVRQTYQKISGRLNNSTTQGSELDLRKDLGLERSSNDYVLGAELAWSGWRLYFTYSSAQFDSDTTLARDIAINGTTFALGTQLDAEITMEFWRVLLAYTIYANVNFGAGIDLDFEAISLSYSFSNGTLKEEADRLLPVLRPGFHIDFAFSKPLVFTLGCSGMMIEYKDVKFASAHASFTARWYLGENFFLFGEGTYEYLRADSKRDDHFYGTALFHSWTASAGLGIRF
jgi:hypothetical protein